MELIVEELAGGLTRAALVGRMDVAGALSVDERFRVLSRLRRTLLVDLSGLTFMASMGLRTLVAAARSLADLGGRMALVGPQPNVEKVLETTGIGEMIGVHPSLEAAVLSLQR
jgi:anti-anti-sigma factor